jgi:aspartate kinase
MANCCQLNYWCFVESKGIPAKLADTRELIITDSNFGDAQPLEAVSKKNVIQIFNENKDSVLVITGFIGSNAKHETTTLGRNGSNYTASLVANYINAEELQNFTHVDGIYTANRIGIRCQRLNLSYNEANEMANFEQIFCMRKQLFQWKKHSASNFEHVPITK